MIITGRGFDFAVLFLIVAVVIGMILRSHLGDFKPIIKTLPAILAIEEGINRSVEMGKSVHFSPGRGDIDRSDRAPAIMAALSVLNHVAKFCADKDVPLWVSYGKPEIYTLIYDQVQDAYESENNLEGFDPDRICFFYKDSYAAGVAGLLEREKPGLNVIVGAYGSSALIIAETGQHVGAMQIAGQNTIHQIPFFIACCDYVLMGEEMLVAGSVIAGDNLSLSSIHGQDIIKLLTFALLIIGSILMTFGVTTITEIMGV